MGECLRIVVALGGNALLPPKENANFEDQQKVISKTAKLLAEVAKKHQLIITHGNGTQVGDIYSQQDFARIKKPLSVCGAESQGQIGYMLQQQLENEFLRRKLHKRISTVISQVEVMAYDSAFNNPTKPIGPFYSAAKKFIHSKSGMKYFLGRGFRTVVPSPAPIKIIELAEIEYLLEKGFVVICCGGGGIPVIKNRAGYSGIDAVIDKDRTASLLSRNIDADMLVILTDVDGIYLNYKRKNEKKITEISERNLKDYLTCGYFEEGTMKPKVEAVIDFVSRKKKPAVIGHLSNIKEVIDKKNCTVILP